MKARTSTATPVAAAAAQAHTRIPERNVRERKRSGELEHGHHDPGGEH